MIDGTLIAVQITKISTLADGSVSLTMHTPEVSPGKVGELFALRNKVAYTYISAQQVSLAEQKLIDGMEPELTGKRPSERLRSVLYLNWKNNNEGYPDSESHYRAKLEAIIQTYKDNLPPNH